MRWENGLCRNSGVDGLGIVFRMLGGIRVSAEEGAIPVELRGAKLRSFLAILLMYQNRIVPIDTIVAALWDSEPPRSAVGNIRTHATGLRQAVGPAARLLNTSGGYRLDVPPLACDHVLFEAEIAAARVAAARGDHGRAADLLNSALGLWESDSAAVGVPRCGPLARWLAHLEEERTRTVEDLAATYLRLNEPRAALHTLMELLAESPLRSRAWALRMRAHHVLGELSGVTGAYFDADQVHRAELGLPAGRELRELYAELIAG